MNTKTLDLTAELREGTSRNTGRPYRFYIFYVEVNGVKIPMKPENHLASDVLASHLDNE